MCVWGGGGRLAANTAANAGSNGGCVCLFVPTTKSLARPILWKHAPPPPTPYLTPASTIKLSADPALARICSSNTDFPSEPSCLVRTRQRKSKKEARKRAKLAEMWFPLAEDGQELRPGLPVHSPGCLPSHGPS